MEPQLTVVCAVWHRQPNRDLLLAQHVRCLARQTVPVKVIYVADGGCGIADVVEQYGEQVTSVLVDRDVTVRDSFMVGLALTDTEYFATLNLDDYWFRDAAAQHLRALRSQHLDMVGGDWEIRFTPTADIDRTCFALDELRPFDQWPPRPVAGQRLGSGDGTSPTYGPAPMFRTAAVRRVGGFARSFGDGTPVKTIIDYILWDRLARAGRRIGRLPKVVGTYLSHPDAQLEFRNGGSGGIEAEHRRYAQHGARL